MTASWALISLTEFIAAVGRPDIDVDLRDALGKIAETLDAEVAAVCGNGQVHHSLGFGRSNRIPTQQLLDLSKSDDRQTSIEGIGGAYVVRADVEGTDRTLLLARTSDTFTTDELAFVRAVGRVLGLSMQMRSALVRERRIARHDSLTGLPNRGSIQDHLEQRIHSVEETPVTVLFVDLDKFKLTNDSLGHAFGDDVLTTVSDRLRTTVRGSDIVGRLAGDEFVVICEGITEVGAIELAERIQQAISKPIRRGTADFVITASVGIAQARSNDAAEQLINNADLAMYRAKEQGRARIEIFDQEMRASVEHRVTVDQELRRAIRDREFVVYVQPVVDLHTRELVSHEALVRWEHPEYGLIAPGDFIPIAEESGIITSLDRVVIAESLRLISETTSGTPIAVNLSAKTFTDQSLVPWLDKALKVHEVDPELLTFEVTETALIDHRSTAADQIRAIRGLGCSVIIDDFGTGYSSLSHLQTFDVDGVKIDRSFVAVLGEDVRASAIVAAVLHMAEALDLSVVAEGVEREQQIERLLELADRFGSVEIHAQGFLFGRPAPELLVPGQAPSQQFYRPASPPGLFASAQAIRSRVAAFLN